MAHSNLVQSLLRGVDVMELVAQSERGLSLGEVCVALKLKQPTAHNLLRTLVAREFVEKTANPVRYRLGQAVTRLAEERNNQVTHRRAGEALQRAYGQARALLPIRLAAQDEVSLTFGQAIGGQVMMLQRVRMNRPGVVEKPNHPYSPYESAAALLFQAYWTPDERESYQRRYPFYELGVGVWKSMQRLEVFLQRVREVGYALPPLYPPGQVRLAVPVFGSGHQLLGSVGAGVWVKGALPRRAGC